jgi:hypothetical protein
MPEAKKMRHPVFGLRGILRVMIAGSAIILSMPVFAVTDKADLLVGVKTLPLLNSKIMGTATLAILFDPANPSSQQEALSIKTILEGKFETPGDLKLLGILVPTNDLNKMAGSRIAILTNGLSAHYTAISNAAASSGILTMSTDLGCVRANKCVLGIVSKPHVEIYYSRAAASSAKVSFGQVFTMLVKQIQE